MNIKRYDISRDSTLYEAWPDVALAPDGRLVCVFNECTHHLNREYTRIMQCVSADRGRTWSPKWPVTAGARGGEWYYNCPRISVLHDGRMVLLVDRLPSDGVPHPSRRRYYNGQPVRRETVSAVEIPFHRITLSANGHRYVIDKRRRHSSTANICGEFFG